MGQTVIFNAVRTPFGKFQGGLSPLSAPQPDAKVVAQAVRLNLTRANVNGRPIALGHSISVWGALIGDSKSRACPLLRKMEAAGRPGRKSSLGFYPYGT
jgi:acetyl-CoA acetyltransferase